MEEKSPDDTATLAAALKISEVQVTSLTLTHGWLRTRHRLAGEYVGPMHAEFPGCAFFPGATEAVKAGRYTDIVETEVP